MLSKLQPGIYIDNSVIEDLRSVDAIVFDCDGVLIDVTKSYDLTISKTVKYVLQKFFEISDGIEIDSKIIEGFKSTGGFNDEVDVTYASILCIVSAKRLQQDQHKFIFDIISKINSSGISSVEKILENLVDINEVKKKLSYPGKHHDSSLYQIFDQIFYGPELYNKLYNRISQFSEPGLIENDLVIVNYSLIEKLAKKYPAKLSLVTGRGKESVRYSLKQLLDKFDLINSKFLEDEPREMAKPNPESLINSILGIQSNHCLYLGDSMEDLIMAKKATKLGHKTTFCGIIGTSLHPKEKLELFQNNDALLVLDSIHLLPKVLNLE